VPVREPAGHRPSGPDATATVTGTTPTAGRVLGGRYQLTRLIARGGMAEVWEGHDATLARPVAVKVLKDDLARDAVFVERFRREAVTAARLGHHAIVATYDAGVDAGTAYIVMELVRGRTLRQLLNATGPLDPLLAVRIAVQVADALAYAHRNGLIHRDVKPANVLLYDEDAHIPQVKVTDFGIAKTTAELGQDLTATGTVLGTPKYFSPEQVDGRGEPDARSDIYALGVVLFEMVAGRAPFDGPTEMATALAHLREQPPSLVTLRPGTPPEVDAIVQRLLAKEPGDRPPTAVAARQALEIVARDLAAARAKRGRTPARGTPRPLAPDTIRAPSLNGPVGAGSWTSPGPAASRHRPASPDYPAGTRGSGVTPPGGTRRRPSEAGPAERQPVGLPPRYQLARDGGSDHNGRAPGPRPANYRPPEKPLTPNLPAGNWPANGNGWVHPDGDTSRARSDSSRNGSTRSGSRTASSRSGSSARGGSSRASSGRSGSARAGRRPTTVGRGPTVVIAILVAAAVIAGVVLLVERAGSRSGAGSTPLAVRSVSVWMNTSNRPPDHTERTKYTIDGKLSTSWYTDPYYGSQRATFGGLYSGEGLAIHLKRSETVNQLVVDSPTKGWAASTYVSDQEPKTGAPVSSWGRPTDSRRGINGNATFSLGGRSGSWVLLWLTNIGPIGQAAIQELTVK